MDMFHLKEELSRMDDPRRSWGNLRHKLSDILVIGLCSVVCCGEDFVDMEEFGLDRREWLSGFLELPNGIPDSDTFRRVFERVEPNALAKSLNAWLAHETRNGGRNVNLDGKTIRGSENGEHNAYHVLSAWVEEHNITLGELAVNEKSNEISAVPALLDLLDIEGDIVTIDAMGCQADIAAKIREKKADYVLALKDNQRNMHESVREYFDWLERERPQDIIYDVWKSKPEKCHGRIEKREISVASADWMEEQARWKDLSAVIRYRCTREVEGVKTVSVRHYISSFDTSAEDFCAIIRGHWSIENRLHWMLDVIFREDAGRARKDNSPLNLNVLRKIALSMLQSVPIGRLSLRKKMMKAARDPSFLGNLLFQQALPVQK
jgi:predicted transposase YbfD/YdcC